jgi:hypothetical protein
MRRRKDGRLICLDRRDQLGVVQFIESGESLAALFPCILQQKQDLRPQESAEIVAQRIPTVRSRVLMPESLGAALNARDTHSAATIPRLKYADIWPLHCPVIFNTVLYRLPVGCSAIRGLYRVRLPVQRDIERYRPVLRRYPTKDSAVPEISKERLDTVYLRRRIQQKHEDSPI